MATRDAEQIELPGPETQAQDDRKDTAGPSDHRQVIEELNNRYALVVHGAQAAILDEMPGGEIRFLQRSTWETWLANRPQVPVNKKMVPAAKFWLTHPDRRGYEKVIFDPTQPVGEADGAYNLWRGFAVEPKEGDCSLFLDHVRENICQGNEDHYQWVMAWCASLFQEPATRYGSSLVIRGTQGTGKTIFGETLGRLVGDRHYKLVDQPHLMTGRFNAHMASLLLLFADEAFWAGNKQAEGRLKNMITGKHQQIEFKGKDPITVSNFMRLLIVGNPDWVVPADAGERRFAVFEIGDQRKRDYAYFEALQEQLDNGGYAALMHTLLNWDYTNVNLREVPRTVELFRQQVESMDPLTAWWFDKLWEGRLFPEGEEPWPEEVPARRLVDDFIREKRPSQHGLKSIQTRLGAAMLNTWGAAARKRANTKYRLPVRVDGNGDAIWKEETGTVYSMKDLEPCRQAFARHLGTSIPWPDTPALDGDNQVEKKEH